MAVLSPLAITILVCAVSNDSLGEFKGVLCNVLFILMLLQTPNSTCQLQRALLPSILFRNAAASL